MNEERPQIILFKTGTINETDRALLKASGYLPVGCDNPSSVALLFPDGQKLRADDIMQAAITALSGVNSGEERKVFGMEVLKSLKRTVAKDDTSPTQPKE